jgi:hypothetical protein
MMAPFSSRDMATLVSPMRGAAVAIPAASRSAGLDREESFNIVDRRRRGGQGRMNDDVDVCQIYPLFACDSESRSEYVPSNQVATVARARQTPTLKVFNERKAIYW